MLGKMRALSNKPQISPRMAVSLSNERALTSFLIGFLLVTAFVLRIQYMDCSRIVNPIQADARRYANIALNLAYCHAYSSNPFPQTVSSPDKWPPGYPLFLSMLIRTTGSMSSFYALAEAIQALLGALTVVLSYLLARYFLSESWAFIAACLVMLSPHMIVTSAFLLTETQFTFLLMLSLFLFMRAIQRKKTSSFAAAGLSMGAAILTRPVIMAFPLIWTGWFCVKTRSNRWRIPLTAVLIYLGIAFSFQTGWVLWQKVFVKGVAPSEVKHQILLGSYPDLIYRNPMLQGMPYLEDPAYAKDLKTMGTVFRSIAAKFRKEPYRYLGWYLRKPFMLWSGKVVSEDHLNYYNMYYSWFDTNAVMAGIRWVFRWLLPILAAIALIGGLFLFLKRLHKPVGSSMPCIVFETLFILIAHYTLIFVVLSPFVRYSVPLIPAVYIMAVYVLVQICSGTIRKPVVTG